MIHTGRDKISLICEYAAADSQNMAVRFVKGIYLHWLSSKEIKCKTFNLTKTDNEVNP